MEQLDSDISANVVPEQDDPRHIYFDEFASLAPLYANEVQCLAEQLHTKFEHFRKEYSEYVITFADGSEWVIEVASEPSSGSKKVIITKNAIFHLMTPPKK